MNDSDKPRHLEYPPDDPIEAARWMWVRIWAYILNPNHSNAITAIATLVICVTGTIYTGFSALVWRENRRAADAALGAANTAARQLELTERPWVKIVDVSPQNSIWFTKKRDGMVFPGENTDQVTINYDVRVKNVGNLPAMNVMVFPEIFVVKWNGDEFAREIRNEQMRFCHTVENLKLDRSASQPIIFPDEDRKISQAAPGFFSERDLSTVPPYGGPFIVPVFIGCMTYEYQSSKHYFRFAYEILNSQRTRFFPPKEGLSAVAMTFERIPQDDDAD